MCLGCIDVIDTPMWGNAVICYLDLWVQQWAKGGEVNYTKLDGKRNTSDMMTKPVEADIIDRHMQALGLQFRSGRNPMTPAYNGKEDGTPTQMG